MADDNGGHVEVWRCEAGHEVEVRQCPWQPSPEAQKAKDYNRFHADDWPECKSNVYPIGERHD